MRALLSYLGVISLGVAACAGATLVAAKLSPAFATDLAKGIIGAFTLLIGFVTLMLREIQGLDSKNVLSELGLERLRRVQRISARRLLWMIAIGILGFIGASFAAFSQANASELIGTIGLITALTSLTVLLSLSIAYLPRLYFDLQDARNTLADLIRSDEIRSRQIDALTKSQQQNDEK